MSNEAPAFNAEAMTGCCFNCEESGFHFSLFPCCLGVTFLFIGILRMLPRKNPLGGHAGNRTQITLLDGDKHATFGR